MFFVINIRCFNIVSRISDSPIVTAIILSLSTYCSGLPVWKRRRVKVMAIFWTSLRASGLRTKRQLYCADSYTHENWTRYIDSFVETQDCETMTEMSLRGKSRGVSSHAINHCSFSLLAEMAMGMTYFMKEDYLPGFRFLSRSLISASILLKSLFFLMIRSLSKSLSDLSSMEWLMALLLPETDMVPG